MGGKAFHAPSAKERAGGDELNQLNEYARRSLAEDVKGLEKRGATKEQINAFLDAMRQFIRENGTDLSYFHSAMNSLLENKDLSKILNKEFLGNLNSLLKYLSEEIYAKGLDSYCAIKILESLTPEMVNKGFSEKIVYFMEAANTGGRQKGAANAPAPWESGRYSEDIGGGGRDKGASREDENTMRRLLGSIEGDKAGIKGMIENFAKTQALAAAKGMGAGFGYAANLAYGIYAVGEEKALRLYKECGIEHFIRYGKKTLEEVSKNLGKKAEEGAKPLLLVVVGKSYEEGIFYNKGEEIEALSRGYRLMVVEAGDKDEFMRKVKKVSAENGKIETLVIVSEGSQMQITLGKEDEGAITFKDAKELKGLRDCFVEEKEVPKVILDVGASGKGTSSIARSLSEAWGTHVSAPSSERERAQYYFDAQGRIFQVNFRAGWSDTPLTKQFWKGRGLALKAEPDTQLAQMLLTCEKAGLNIYQTERVIGVLTAISEEERETSFSRNKGSAFMNALTRYFLSEDFTPESVTPVFLNKLRGAVDYLFKKQKEVYDRAYGKGEEGVPSIVPVELAGMLPRIVECITYNKNFRPEMLEPKFLDSMAELLVKVFEESGVEGATAILEVVSASPQFLTHFREIPEKYDEARRMVKAAKLPDTAENICNFAYALAVTDKKTVLKLQVVFGIQYFLRYTPETLKELAKNSDIQYRKGDPILLVAFGKNSSSQNLYEEGIALEKLTKGYKVIVTEVSSEEELASATRKFAMRHGKIDTLVLGGGTMPGGILLGEYAGGTPVPDDVLNAKDSEVFAELRKHMDYSSGIPSIIIASSAGGGVEELAHKMSLAMDARSFSPTGTTTKTEYRLDGNGRIAQVTYERAALLAWMGGETSNIGSKEYVKGKLAGEAVPVSVPGRKMDPLVREAKIPEGQKERVDFFLFALEEIGISGAQKEQFVKAMEDAEKNGRLIPFLEAVTALIYNSNFSKEQFNEKTYRILNEMISEAYSAENGAVFFKVFTVFLANGAFKPEMLNLRFMRSVDRFLGALPGDKGEVIAGLEGGGGLSAIFLMPLFMVNMSGIEAKLEDAKKIARSLKMEETPEMLINLAYGLLAVGEKNLLRMHNELGIEYFMRYSPALLSDLVKNMEGGAREKPVLLVAANKNDWNGAFYNMSGELEPLLKGYRVVVVEVESEKEFREKVSHVRFHYGKINTLILSGHGSPNGIGMGEDEKEGNLDLSDEKQLRYLKDYFDRSSGSPKVILKSCATGQGGNSIAKFLSDIWDATTFAPIDITGRIAFGLDKKGEIASVSYRRGAILAWGEWASAYVPTKRQEDGALQEIYSKNPLNVEQ